MSKKALLEASEALLSLQDAVVPSAGDQLNVTEQTAEVIYSESSLFKK